MADFEAANQLGQPTKSTWKIPEDLAFEEVIKSRTARPCSLGDFMDYMFHVEHDAENLQFFLWYWDYIERWANLLPRQKALAPAWDPEKAAEPGSRFVRYSHKRARSQKMSKIISIMEMEGESEDAVTTISEADERELRQSVSSMHSSFAARLSSVSALSSPVDSTKSDWQPFTIQPFRDEVSRVVRHYIADSSPRQLALSPKDREACLRATQHTTHPSALLPAFLLVEGTLRGHSHPQFIRWARSNANRPRLLFLRAMGIALIVLGLLVDVLLILSRQSPFFRVVCIALWWPGLTVLISACRNLCIILHFRNSRQVRPWERIILEPGVSSRQMQEHPLSSVVSAGSITPRPLREDPEDESLRSPLARHPLQFEKPKRSTLGSIGSATALVTPTTTTSITASSPPSATATATPLTLTTTTTVASTIATLETTVTTTEEATAGRPTKKKLKPKPNLTLRTNPLLQTFGPKNEYALQAQRWLAPYRRKTLVSRIFDVTAPVTNTALMMMQDRTVFFAVVWGGVGASVLTVGSLFAPRGDLFL